MKKKIFICALLVICLSVLAYGSAAYFTAEGTATNVITAGNLHIALKETAIPAAGGDPVPFADPVGVMPGQSVSKIVQIENTGESAAYVRVAVETAIQLADGKQGEVDLGLVTMDIDTEKWVARDGFYYYADALKPGETSAPLFTAVTFAPEMDNLYQESTATVRILAYATQAAHNGDSALDAAGWPEK